MTTRKPIEQLLDEIDWEPIPGAYDTSKETADRGVPYATHSGVLTITGCKLKVFQLSDGRRIVDADSLDQFFLGFQ